MYDLMILGIVGILPEPEQMFCSVTGLIVGYVGRLSESDRMFYSVTGLFEMCIVPLELNTAGIFPGLYSSGRCRIPLDQCLIPFRFKNKSIVT